MITATDGDKVWYSQGSVGHHAAAHSMVMIQNNLIITSNGYTDVINTSLTTRAAATLAKAARSLRGSISTM